MTVGDIEDVKHQIAVLLAGATFTANLTALAAAKADGITTPALAQIEECEKAQLVNFPAVRLIGLATTFNNDDENGLQEGTHEIAVDVVHVGDDEATLTKHIERLVRAARATLWGTTLGSGINATPLLVQREDYGALAPGVDTAFYKGGGLVVLVTTLVQ